jgi:HlyD family secretion protein
MRRRVVTVQHVFVTSKNKNYTVRIAIPAREIERLKGLKILPGMPVESFIQTSPRTVISYLVKPLHDQISRAFREK